MEFNRIIKLLRKERGITQKQAAEDLGVSQATLWCAWQTIIMFPAIIFWAAVQSATA